jgi:translation initiation factor 3 subunit A
MKKKNWQWTQALDQLMLYYIDLCLKLDEMESLKIGLTSFRDCVQHHHQDSLKIVLEKYVATTEKRFKESCELMGNVNEFFEELHMETNANDFYLNSLNLEKGHAKESVKKSWVILIEAYKRVLNLLYKNKSLLQLYSDFALRAFNQCAQLKAIEDFKALCRVLRANLKFVNKPKNEKKINFKYSEQEVNDTLLNLRHQLFGISWDLGLMQESFNILEELNELMRARSKVPLDMLISYYSKLNEVFLKGEFVLFHAVALMELFSCLARKKEPEKKLKALADRVVLAVLSIGRNSEEFTLSTSLKNKYCVMFSSRQHMPSLNEIITSLATSHLLRVCSAPVQELYRLCNGKYDLFEFSDVLQKELGNVPEEFGCYLTGIKANCVSIILKLVSDFFENIPFEDLKEFISFVDFETVKQEILLLEYTQELNIYLNFEEELVEFGEQRADWNEWLGEHEDFAHRVEETISLAQDLREDESAVIQRTQLENAYMHSFKELQGQVDLENQKTKLQNEGRVFLTKIQKKDDVIDPEEIERREMAKKRKEGEKKINIKILNMKKDKIKEILKIDPKMKLLDIPLKSLKKDDLMQLDYEVFDTIHDKLEEVNKIKANQELKNKYRNYDFLMRYYIADNWETEVKDMEADEIDLDEISRQKEAELENAARQQEELLKGKPFIEAFKKRLLEQRTQEWREKVADFRSNLNDEYRNKIYEKAKEDLEKKKKKEEEERKRNTRFQRQPMGQGRTMEPGRTDPSTITLTRGSNFKPGESSFQGRPTMAKRGENFTKTTSGMAQRGTGLAQRGTGMAQRGTGMVQRGTGMLQRGTGMGQRGTGFGQNSNTGLTRPTTTLASRGANLNQNKSSTMFNRNKPTVSLRNYILI